MKRMIKKHLLPVLFWSFVWFVIVGVYVNVNEIAALQHGYRTLGIEDILFLALIISALAKKAVKSLKELF